MLCVLILYLSGKTYSLKPTPNDRFFEKLFMGILFTLRVFARNLAEERHFVFRFDVWPRLPYSLQKYNVALCVSMGLLLSGCNVKIWSMKDLPGLVSVVNTMHSICYTEKANTSGISLFQVRTKDKALFCK